MSLNITHKDMTRFNITLEESIEAVLWSLINAKGKEIFVPKLKSYKLLDVAEAINAKAKLNFTGVRPGEKIHEELISRSESYNTVDLGDYYAIMPDQLSLQRIYGNKKMFNQNISYNSNLTNNFLSIQQIKKLIAKINKNYP